MIRRHGVLVVALAACGPQAPTGDGGATGDASSGHDEDASADLTGVSLDDAADDEPVVDEGPLDEGGGLDVGSVDCNVAPPVPSFTSDAVSLDTELFLAVGDVGGSPAPDLVILGDGIGVQVWLGNDGGWDIHAPDIVISPDTFAGLYTVDIAVGDVIGTGEVDLVTIDSLSQLHVSPGDGSGAFGETLHVTLPGPPSRLVVADIDGDADDDSIVVFADTELAVITNDGETPGEAIELQTGLTWLDDIEVQPLGAGGAQHLLVTGGGDSGGLVEYALLTATLDAALAGDWAFAPTYGDVFDLAVRDVDADGLGDVAIVSAAPMAVGLHHGLVDGTLALEPIVALPSFSDTIAVGDFDSSGPDAAIVQAGAIAIVDLQCATIATLAGPTVRGPLLLTDSNGDARSDLVARTDDGRGVAVYMSAP